MAALDDERAAASGRPRRRRRDELRGLRSVFVPVGALVVGAVTAIVVGAMFYRPAARTTTTGTTTTAESRTPCPVSAPLGPGAKDHGAVAAASARLAIQAEDVFFAPTCETGVHAGTIHIVVHNTGQALHNVSVPDQNIDQDVTPGATITVNVTVGTTPIRFFCKYHRAAGMVGALLPGP